MQSSGQAREAELRTAGEEEWGARTRNGGLGEEEAWAVSAEQGDLLPRDPPLLCVRHIWGASEPSAVR